MFVSGFNAASLGKKNGIYDEITILYITSFGFLNIPNGRMTKHLKSLAGVVLFYCWKPKERKQKQNLLDCELQLFACLHVHQAFVESNKCK